ncbi:MAG TPA: DPP IV N-terminal domain-containing protein, partial [Anaerolineae bacterium]|nr:DPP IV N-terminal domain-containing protein [Anaerolineae bacterium]
MRGKNSNGQWSAATHYPVLIDRQPPTIGEVMPTANGAGGPNFIQVAINDATGLDLSKLQLQIDNKPIGIGRGVIYDPEFSALQIQPYGLKTPLPAIPNGQKVNMSVRMSDYAGNAIASPFSWAFTADVPKVSGDQFRGLTKNGGESPALSPDGSALVFVTARSGVPQLWLVNTSDYGESSNSAHQLIAGSAYTFDAAWSADGKSIAFVSDATGSNQIWISDQNGGGAKAITSIEGSIGSPTWSPDGHTLAFVRNGNIWQLNVDGSALKAITAYPDAPIQKVEWQPNGNVLAVDYKLYQETIELYDLATNQLTPLTNGGVEHDPAWLNYSTILYAAPQGLNQPDAIWKINTDGSDARMIDGSGQPGVADIQPAAAADGSSIAMVSTRNGTRDIYLQATLQIARFDVSPST